MNVSAILTELKSQRDRLNSAIAVLERVSGNSSAPIHGRRHMSAAARKRISLAQKARWAAQRKGTKAKASKKHGGITAAGRKKLSQMMKARWAARKKAVA